MNRNCPVHFVRCSLSEAIQFKSKGRAQIECDDRSLCPNRSLNRHENAKIGTDCGSTKCGTIRIVRYGSAPSEIDSRPSLPYTSGRVKEGDSSARDPFRPERYTRERENLRQDWRERAYTGETPGKFEWFPV